MKKNLLLLGILLALGIVIYFIVNRSHTSTLANEPLTNFAIEDTSTVTKLFIADHVGNTIKLERQPNNKLWKLNDKYLAREDAVNLILDMVKRISVRGSVPASGRDNMMKMIASSGKKLEIYTGEDTPAKIYYIGTNTPDHMGTIMLLEIPELGRSQEPYICHIEGFTGFLNPRIFSSEMEWRYTGVFEYPELQFKSVKVEHLAIPNQSFEMTYGGDNAIGIKGCTPDGKCNVQMNAIDSVGIKDYLLLYKKVHVESYNTYLKPQAADSIKRQVPVHRITVVDNNNQSHSVSIYPKRAKAPVPDENGILSEWDPEYFWIVTEKGEMAMGQKYTFSPLLLPLSKFAR